MAGSSLADVTAMCQEFAAVRARGVELYRDSQSRIGALRADVDGLVAGEGPLEASSEQIAALGAIVTGLEQNLAQVAAILGVGG